MKQTIYFLEKNISFNDVRIPTWSVLHKESYHALKCLVHMYHVLTWYEISEAYCCHCDEAKVEAFKKAPVLPNGEECRPRGDVKKQQ